MRGMAQYCDDTQATHALFGLSADAISVIVTSRVVEPDERTPHFSKQSIPFRILHGRSIQYPDIKFLTAELP